MKHTIGVIGLGSIGARHAMNLTNLEHQVVGYDPDETLNFDAWMRFKKVHTIEEMLECDAFVIASPTLLHAAHIEAINGCGRPILVEKPIVHTFNTPLDDFTNVAMVGYNLRFHPCVQQAQEWLDHGDIGTPIWANFTLAQHSEKPPYLRDGVILNWSHEIDLALHLLGPARMAGSSTQLISVAVDPNEPKHPDPTYPDIKFRFHDNMTDILLAHEDGCRSTVHLDYLTVPEIRQTIIVGDGGTIIMDLVRHTAWLRDVDGGICAQLEGSRDTWNRTYIDEMQAFIDCIDGKEAIGCTADEGLKVLEICLEVRKQAGLL